MAEHTVIGIIGFLLGCIATIWTIYAVTKWAEWKYDIDRKVVAYIAEKQLRK